MMGGQRFENITRRMRRKIAIQPTTNFDRSVLKKNKQILSTIVLMLDVITS
jgi:hypothetical protein